jgi:hypothetical protein
MGTLIGDALGMGPHWYYDLDLLKEDYGEWIDDYTSRKAGRYHAGLTAGENSQTGQVVGFLLESVGALGSYDESDFCLRLDALLATLDGNPPGRPLHGCGHAGRLACPAGRPELAPGREFCRYGRSRHPHARSGGPLPQ